MPRTRSGVALFCFSIVFGFDRSRSAIRGSLVAGGQFSPDLACQATQAALAGHGTTSCCPTICQGHLCTSTGWRQAFATGALAVSDTVLKSVRPSTSSVEASRRTPPTIGSSPSRAIGCWLSLLRRPADLESERASKYESYQHHEMRASDLQSSFLRQQPRQVDRA
jgi:hypothetical protein